MSPKTDLSCHPQHKRHDYFQNMLESEPNLALVLNGGDSPVRSCDYSRVAVAEAWVGGQEAAAAAAGQHKVEGPGQTGMR